MGTTRTGLALALTLATGLVAPAMADDKAAAKPETVRGVIAGVTLEGETAIDFTTRHAQAAETTFLTIVGEPAAPEASAGAERRRHNVYVVWMNPRAEVRDATGPAAKDGKEATAKTTLDKVEVGDRVEVTFRRREPSRSGGDARSETQSQKHGRHRTYFGDAVSLTILDEPGRHDPKASQPNSERSRDDDKDKIKKD